MHMQESTWNLLKNVLACGRNARGGTRLILIPMMLYEVREIQNNLLTYYEEDFSKHAPKEVVPRIMMVWKFNSVPTGEGKPKVHVRCAARRSTS